MSLLLKDVHGESEKTWANEILFALCLKALAGYKPPAEEQAFIDLIRMGNALRFPDVSFLPVVLAAMRRGLDDPAHAGALVALRVADTLDEPRSRPAKK